MFIANFRFGAVPVFSSTVHVCFS